MIEKLTAVACLLIINTASQEHPYIQALSKRPILEWSPVFSQYLVPSESNIPVDAVFPSPSDISSGLYPIESIAHYQVMDDQILFCSGNAVYLGTLGQVQYKRKRDMDLCGVGMLIWI